jgi:hypothetical protein
VDFPPEWGGGGDTPLTLRVVIARIVSLEVAAFRKRQRQHATFQAMSTAEIDAGAQRGAVKPGSQAPIQDVNDEAAVAAALQAFEDGIYLVILNGEEQRDLDREVYITPDSTLTFIRLVMLAGA